MRALRVLVVCLAAVLGGCGTADDRTQARTVTERFVAAYEQDRGQEACDQLSDATVEELERQEQKSCDEAITDVELVGGDVAQARVYIANAKVDLVSGESVFLNRESDGWKISAVGCRSTQGDPQNEPLDCELEA